MDDDYEATKTLEQSIVERLDKIESDIRDIKFCVKLLNMGGVLPPPYTLDQSASCAERDKEFLASILKSYGLSVEDLKGQYGQRNSDSNNQ